MRRFVQPLWGACAALALLLFVAVPALAQPGAADCQFVLGFATFHAVIPNVVGDCVSNEYHNPVNGDALQKTTNGLLVWRKADNWTAFTNGATTWINGPFGMQSRSNDTTFPWEQQQPNGTTTVNATLTIHSTTGDEQAATYFKSLQLTLDSVGPEPGGQKWRVSFLNAGWPATFKDAGSFVIDQGGAAWHFRSWKSSGTTAPNESVSFQAFSDAPYTPGATERVVLVVSGTFTDEAGATHTATATSDGVEVALQ